MLFRRIYHPRLAQASYLVACARTREAIAIDPTRDVGQYLAAARAEGVRIVAVTETHVHADFISGASELAAAADARLYLSGEGRAPGRTRPSISSGAALFSSATATRSRSARCASRCSTHPGTRPSTSPFSSPTRPPPTSR